MSKIFLSGGSGFLGSNLIKTLLTSPSKYQVITSVRSEEKGNKLLENLENAKISTDRISYEIVEDVGGSNSFDETLKKHKDIDVFLHTAAPFHFKSKDVQKDIINPAVNGLKNALQSVEKYGDNIKRFVLTSSIASAGVANPKSNKDTKFNEKTWNEMTEKDAIKNPLLAYYYAKLEPERLLWEYTKNKKPNFAATTVLPAMIFGPQAFPIGDRKELNTSSEVINKILKLQSCSKLPPGEGLFIDVRDVCKSIIDGFEKENTKDKRLLLYSGSYNTQKILNIIRDNFPEVSLMLPVGKPENGDKEDPTIKFWSNEETRKILGFEFIDLEKSVEDSVEQILEVKNDK
ncbi:uncharacterized protein KGF55_000752 [Candida pseudojiufengensis]|uniref:uncharacterized protein n=1 Tax=Candida pseudojiufengensis TaxID=497109 RepID=UPI00222556B6|nr:uncharacterized protein KGF55_000752 [Candida pseudojiufengensis]KAI5966443.1 hypothetical protein KGF55_000752 [Candida pseudojiufengensis]